MSARALLHAVTVAIAAGCAAGPDYAREELPTPAVFASSSDAAAFPTTAPDPSWWRQLASPQLDALVERALADNLDLRAALTRIREARSAAGVAEADLWPDFDASSGYTRTRTTAATPSPVRGISYDTWVVGFDMSWELDLFGRLRRESEARTAEVGATEADAAGVRLALIAEVTAAYADLIGALRRHAVANESIVAAAALLSITQSRATGGVGTELDTTRAERLLAATRARLPGLDRDWRRAALRLGVLTGQAPGAVADALLSTAPVATVPDVVALGLPAEFVRQRPDVQAAERRVHAANARVGGAIAQRYPSISLTGFFGLESNRGQDLFQASSRAWRVGPSVRVPLFTGGGVTETIRVRDAQLEEARLALQQQVLLAFEEVENAITGLQQERRRSGELATAVAAAERSRALAQQRFDAGIDDFLTVLDAEQTRLDLADQQATASAEVVRQFAALHKALGCGVAAAEDAAAGQ